MPVIRTAFLKVGRLLGFILCAGAVSVPADVAAAQTAAPAKKTVAVKKTTTARTTTVKPTVRRTTVRRTPAKASTATRRVRAARARAALRARQLQEAQAPHYKLDDSGALVPDLRAEAAIIYDPQTGQILWEQNSNNQRSIASITKVMTAAVFLEEAPDLNEVILVERADVRAASTTYLRAGYKVTTGNLLHLLLIGSDNAAARVLARISPYGSAGFIGRMNEKAAELGLDSTHYADPSGLLSANVSSAYDMARLITFATSDERIGSIMRMPHYSFAVGRQTISVNSTNQLVRGGDVDVVGGKTGFIRAAGYCLATLLRLPQNGPQVAVVVLGAQSNAGRFWETRHLFNWLSTKTQQVLGSSTPVATTVVASPN
jgi:D-alanyl-D-alanine endopeptidase (penicillin-binding protein 7)